MRKTSIVEMMVTAALVLCSCRAAAARAQSSGDINAYVDAARQATATIHSPDDALRAGFVPVFGNAPLQGEHYARPDLIMRDTFDVSRPSVVMFAPVNGKQTLVGVAYTYYLPTDRMQPRGWMGEADVWHSHDDIARIPGKHIVMMHVWLVTSPLGILAHDNPSLPYLAAGVVAPKESDLTDHEAKFEARSLGLALGLVTAPPDVINTIQRQAGPDLAQRIAARRAALSDLIAKMRSEPSNNELRALAIADGDSLVALYREGARSSPRLQATLDAVVDMYRAGAHRHDSSGGA